MIDPLHITAGHQNGRRCDSEGSSTAKKEKMCGDLVLMQGLVFAWLSRRDQTQIPARMDLDMLPRTPGSPVWSPRLRITVISCFCLEYLVFLAEDVTLCSRLPKCTCFMSQQLT